MKQTALITGASSGIGRELARVLARRYDLVLTARREELLNSLAAELQTQTRVRVVPLDLAQRGAPQKLFDSLRDETIDILVNNAGFATYGPFWETPLDDETQLLQLNIVALTQLTKLFLLPMRERNRGKILNVGSTAAFQAGPLMAVYYASKAYVLHFSEALATELEGTGVSVTALCPGPTESEFQTRARMTMSRLVQGQLMSAREVAEIGVRGMEQHRRIVIPGRAARAFVQLVRVLPRRTTAKLVLRAQKPD
jgi:short-subunit dehydrogenase